jgi:hypothetical protein
MEEKAKKHRRDPMIGIGGGPTRATTLPEDYEGRKRVPVATGVLDYFPDALVSVAEVSWQGNEQHNPGQPLNWARGKSVNEADTLLRHFMQRGTRDVDGLRHSAKVAWRALALLQKEIEEENGILVDLQKKLPEEAARPERSSSGEKSEIVDRGTRLRS